LKRTASTDTSSTLNNQVSPDFNTNLIQRVMVVHLCGLV
jgi:hypothetical protein